MGCKPSHPPLRLSALGFPTACRYLPRMSVTTGRGRPDRVETTLLVAGLVSLLGFAMSIPLHVAEGLSGALNSIGFSLPFLIASVQLAYRAVRDGRSSRPWWFVAVGLAVFGLSNLLYSTPPLPDPFGTLVPDAVWLFGFPPLIVGVALLVLPLTRAEGAVAILDAVVVAVGVFTVAIVFLSEALEGAAERLTTQPFTLNLFEVLADDVLLAIALGAVHATNWRPPRWVWTMLAAVVVFSICDALYTVQIAYGTYVEGGLLDLGWLVSAFLLAIAAYFQRDPTALNPKARRWVSNVQTLVPAALIPAATIALVYDADGALGTEARIAGLTAVTLSGLRLFVAVRQAKNMASELRDARLDSLTGLPNLRALRALPRRALEGCVLVTLDLDGFGEINADFGNRIGDQILIEVADRAALSTRERDIVARIGGDEFAVLLHDATPELAGRIAETLVMQIEAEILVEGLDVRVSACAGISSILGSSGGVDQLVAEAELALREAKHSGSGIVRSYAGATGVQSQERLKLRADLKDSLRGSATDFIPYFQPIVSLSDGRLLCVEALVRWHRGGQVLPPGAFIAEVERSASMTALTAHMLQASLTALRTAAIDVPVTVNVPPDLVDGHLLTMVRTALTASGSTPAQLIVEITEDAIMRNPAQAASILGELHGLGVQILLDDFGTGWSGLSALRDFVVDGLKLDGSFTRAMDDDATTHSIVRAVSDLASKLGMLVIYEGVEDPDQLDRLRQRGEGYVQGFAVSHPVPIRQLAQWIAGGSSMIATPLRQDAASTR